jgi:hypothetical protein
LAAVLAVGLLALGLDAVAAQPADPWPGEPTFTVESVEVRGLKRATPEVVIAASLLELGKAYSEAQLRDSVHRVRRLPFILDAEVSLDKGKDRGTYVVVFAVEETRRFFFGTDLDVSVFSNPLRVGDVTTTSPLTGEDSNNRIGLTAGARFFVGNYGVAFAALQDSGIEVGYTHNNLFDRGITVGVTLADRDLVERTFSLGLDPSLSQWDLDDSREIQLEGAIPLSGRRAVRLSAAYLQSPEANLSPLLGFSSFLRDEEVQLIDALEVRYWRLGAAWALDSRNDPILPTEGTSASLGLTAELLKSDSTRVRTFRLFGGARREELLPGYESRTLALVANGAHHWPLTRRQTLSLGLRAALGRSEVDLLPTTEAPLEGGSFTSYQGLVDVQWSLDLRRPGSRKKSDLRWENGVRYGFESTSPRPSGEGNPLETLELETALVRRNAWGLFRFSLSYLEVGEVLR